MKSKYCKLCSQKVEANWLVRLISRVKVFELENGTYCEKCARTVVIERRKAFEKGGIIDG